MELRKSFGLRLRALRKQHHWTLKELAGQLHILPTQLNKYECGINWPPADKIVEIAALFHVSLDYLLVGSPNDSLPLRNQRLLDRFRILENFPFDLQETLIKLIDALIFKQQVQAVLNPSEPSSRPQSLQSLPAPAARPKKKKSRSAVKSPQSL